MKFPSSSLGGIAAIFVDAFILISMFLILMLANIVMNLPETTALATVGPAASDQSLTTEGIRLDRDPELLTPENLGPALAPYAQREGIPVICALGIPIEAVWPLKARIEAALGREASFLVCTGEN